LNCGTRSTSKSRLEVEDLRGRRGQGEKNNVTPARIAHFGLREKKAKKKTDRGVERKTISYSAGEEGSHM